MRTLRLRIQRKSRYEKYRQVSIHEHTQTLTHTTVKHTQITQSLRGAAHSDKTGSLRAIYGHLMHSEPPISDCVGREMRCGVFPIQLHANILTITSSTTSGHLHSAVL